MRQPAKLIYIAQLETPLVLNVAPAHSLVLNVAPAHEMESVPESPSQQVAWQRGSCTLEGCFPW